MSEAHQLASDFAVAYRAATGKVPIILGMEIYEHFGSPCSIVWANQFEVAVMGTDLATVATISNEELKLWIPR